MFEQYFENEIAYLRKLGQIVSQKQRFIFVELGSNIAAGSWIVAGAAVLIAIFYGYLIYWENFNYIGTSQYKSFNVLVEQSFFFGMQVASILMIPTTALAYLLAHLAYYYKLKKDRNKFLDEDKIATIRNKVVMWEHKHRMRPFLEWGTQQVNYDLCLLRYDTVAALFLEHIDLRPAARYMLSEHADLAFWQRVQSERNRMQPEDFVRWLNGQAIVLRYDIAFPYK